MIFHPNPLPQLNGSRMIRFMTSVKNARLNCLGIFYGILLFLHSNPLEAESLILFEQNAETVHTKEEGYVTSGAVILDVEASRIRDLMSDASGFDRWLLRGMGEQTALDKRLRVSLNSLEWKQEEPDSCRVAFSLFVTRRWILHDKHMLVEIESSPEKPAWVNQIRYNLPLGGALVKEGGYGVTILSMGQGRSLVQYHFQIHLAGIAELLFSRKMYTRNIEWYINAIMDNCINYLHEQS